MTENREIEYGATCKLKEWNMYGEVEGVEALKPTNLTKDELARSTIIFELYSGYKQKYRGYSLEIQRRTYIYLLESDIISTTK